ncbi:FG-GAP-like repeat-containing protein, partial [Flavobacterium sp. NRK F10]|uniref:FG-GAP repeat domain-containing protein n=1 Tax=Flavobacterium sp. NRK F10 TaxID=2954931 RepID=UPI0020913393
MTPTLGSGEVGSTRGELSVSKTGGALYTIPIDLPPGVNNVAPNISLNYSSHSGDGIAGWGWNIGGISKISRIQSTIHHDGEVDEIDFDSLDRFALDGQRLVLTSGIYGEVGSTYETENFSNNKITLTSAYGVSCFKIEYPNGNIAYYGIPGPNNYPSIDYVITKWENPQGLTINYEYDLSYLQGLSFRIKAINYGSTLTGFINKIEFIYGDKNKQEVYYVGGYSFWNPKILTAIKIIGNGVPYKNYYLTHDLTSTGFERLKSIQEKTGDNSKSLNPISFLYKNNQSNFNQQISYSHKGEKFNQSAYFPSDMVQGDFLGKGEIEIKHEIYDKLYIVNDDYSTSAFWYAKGYSSVDYLDENFNLSNKQGTISIQNDIINGSKKVIVYSYDESIHESVVEYERPFNTISEINEIGTTICSNDYKQNLRFVGDFNGDKLSDFVSIKITNGIAETQFVNLDRRLNDGYEFLSGQINIGSILNCSDSGDMQGYSIFQKGDFNGDGKTDLFVFRSSPYNKIEVYTLNNNNTFVQILSYQYDLNVNLFKQGKYPIIIGDYNGDGKTDVFFAWQKKILYSNGVIF